MLYTVVVVCNLLFLVQNVYSLDVTVRTSRGVVIGRGLRPNPSSGVSYDAFQGIPYGQIPARFKPPEPRMPWSDPLLAQSDGPTCPQVGSPFSEDCLYLNVFTPANASQTPGRLPVMVFYHGSAFTQGTCSSSFYGPDFLVPHGVILVTLNYRLGAAGYLTLGTPEAPGNLGLYDSLLALRWVREEIANFGGDPAQVTVVGQSAGSAIIQFMYITPLSAGLFKYAICQSGSALSDDHTLSAEEAVTRARVLADAVGCDLAQSNSQLLACLQRADISTIVRLQNITMTPEVRASGVTIPFRPVLDASFGKPAFFTDTLENMMKKAAGTARPMLTGFNTDEGIIIFQGHGRWDLVEDNLAGFIPRRLQGSLRQSEKELMVDKIRKEYFPERKDQNKILDIVRLYSDTIFIYPNVEFTRQFANVTYAYVLTSAGPWAPLPDYFSSFRVTGVQHGAELNYLFYHGQDLGGCSYNQPGLRMRDLIVSWWTTFAKTGSPDYTGTWKRLSEGHYLQISPSPTAVNSSVIEDRYYTFWATLGSSVASDSPSSSTVVDLAVLLVAVLCSIAVSPLW